MVGQEAVLGRWKGCASVTHSLSRSWYKVTQFYSFNMIKHKIDVFRAFV